MKTLIVEDDFVSRALLQELLRDYGPPHRRWTEKRRRMPCVWPWITAG